MEPTPTKSKLGSPIAIVILVIFIAAYVFVLHTYKSEGANRGTYLAAATEAPGEDRIEAFAKIVSADVIKGDVIVRLDFYPHGSFLAADGSSLTRDLSFDISSATGKHVYEFKKGRRMDPVEATIELYEGEPMDYPFDTHKGNLRFFFSPTESAAATGKPASGAGSSAHASPTPKPETTSAKSDAAAGDEGGEEAASAEADDASIPIALDLRGSVNGLTIDANYSKDNEEDVVDVDLDISRAGTTKFFSMFIMVAMWCLTIAVLFLVHRVYGGRKIELAMFSFLAALLFAFPALRNSQPGTPPIGTLSDFIAFFWAEVLLAFSLLAILLRWLVRGPGGESSK